MKTSLVWAAVALLGIIAAVALGLSFAGWTDQAVIGWTAAMGTLAGTVFGLLIKVESKTDAQTTTLAQIRGTVETVERRTNGELDQRIAAAMEEAAELGSARVLAELRRQGTIK